MRKFTFFLVAAIAVTALAGEHAAAQNKADRADKSAEVIAKMRAAIGGGKLDSLKTFSLEARTARNVGERQMTSDVELYLDLPDRYLRVENVTAPIARTMQMGFNGDKVIRPAGGGAPGAPMVIMNGMPMGADGGGRGGQRMTIEVMAAGPGGPVRGAGPGGEMTPEQQKMMEASMIRSQRVELSRMMLGWFGMAHPALNVAYSYAGEAESPDGKAHIISVKADGGFDVKLFVDQATNMPLMVSWMAPEPVRIQNTGRAGGPAGAAPPPPPPPAAPGHAGASHVQGAPPAGQSTINAEEIQRQIDEARKNARMIEYRVYFGDWKEVDGIQFPHMLQRATGSNTTEEWTIGKVKVNPKIDAKKFQ